MVRQTLSLKDKFGTQHPHDWLVWEPGAWRVPASGEKLADTRAAPADSFAGPPRGDCLCFELKCPPGTQITLRRAPENDIVINDATVSREHVMLTRGDKGWTLTAQRPTQLAGKSLTDGTTTELNSGDRIVAGGVRLTFLSSAGFWDRQKGEAQKVVG